jgi:ATP-binding cassette subfamily A (ABC1) protein 3
VPVYAVAVEGGSHGKAQKTLACLASQVCFGLGAVVMAKLESAGTGVIASSANIEIDNWSYNATIGMFIADFFIYLLLALYFQQIIPSEWGTHQKPWFCFLPRYWCPKSIDTTKRGSGNGSTEMGNIPHRVLQETDSLVSSSNSNKSHYFEPVAEHIKKQLGVSIQHLHKKFHTDGETEPFVAVKDMNLDLYSGQILALLGHNGAGLVILYTFQSFNHSHRVCGVIVSLYPCSLFSFFFIFFRSLICSVILFLHSKTTTINMMTGMIAPTDGDALVYGASIRDDMAAVRKILGVCPQHNILFDLLTVKEHLELFAAIKGVPSEETDAAVQEMIAQVGLTEKVNDKSAALSGGMQRKLSVGIALLGDSKIIFLDEPTSG